MTFTDGFMVGAGIIFILALLIWILVILLQGDKPDDDEELEAAVARTEALTARLEASTATIADATGTIANVEPTPTEGP